MSDLHEDLEGLTLFAWVGRDELGGEVMGLKQAHVAAGVVPLVAIAGHLGKLERHGLRDQLQGQADRYGRTIRLVRFVAVEEVLTIEPKP